MRPDDGMGEHEEGARGAESIEARSTAEVERFYRRPYAVANITHGTVTILCADNAASAYAQVRVHENDVMWHTTRIKEGKTHHHDEQGKCMPKVYHTRPDGRYLAR